MTIGERALQITLSIPLYLSIGLTGVIFGYAIAMFLFGLGFLASVRQFAVDLRPII